MMKRMLDHSRRVAPMCAVSLAALAAYAYFDRPYLWTLSNALLAAAGILGVGVVIVVYEEFVARHIYAKAHAKHGKKARD